MENIVIRLGPSFNYMITGLGLVIGGLWLTSEYHPAFLALVVIGLPLVPSSTVVEIDTEKRRRRVAYVFYVFYIGGWYDIPGDDSLALNKSSSFQRNSWFRYTSSSGYVYSFSVVLLSSSGNIELYSSNDYYDARQYIQKKAQQLGMSYEDHYEAQLREREEATGKDLTPGF